MSGQVNNLGQPVGNPLPGWSARQRPAHDTIRGQFCRLEPLDCARHGGHLHDLVLEDREGSTWTYLYYGPFETEAAFHAWLNNAAASNDPLFFAVVDAESGRAMGLVSYLRVEPAAGAIAVGHIIFTPSLRQTPAATECMYLLLRQAFDGLGYRRCEWRCDVLNSKSRAAAERFGFRLEGVFRQATVNKGRNRDTACLSIIDGEWPQIRANFERWLNPGNFDAEGRQLERLSQMNATG